ncbi:MAG: NAD-dependent epimerase/dehydratase family protein [Gemmobacter sp.]|uniref:NAD-dependent epimerase/dehydratase family protein n=1 Tax=Gemmobacter sp. TaxID=1898957 RepID=UPI001A425719|nr:NAD-dependent epimerase/dehydratase family protein [Gemmobacter sp.]MBL8561125.1 NAD-dependent epimerase/dehydratase family protein [Gemmobacter sp.]
MSATGPLILGASGEIGRSLARVWAMAAPGAGPGLWQHRPGTATPPDVPTLSWNILAEAPPALPAGLSGIVVLAGVTAGDTAALALNTRLAETALALARAHGIARVLLASSQAVYGAHPGPAQENSPCAPLSAYGAAKLAMEQAMAGAPEVTALRIGNYAGSGALFRAARQGPVSLDQFPDGRSPVRSYIGPVSLARVLAALLAHPGPLPPVLNVALPGGVEMAALLEAAALPFTLRPAPATALPEAVMDVTRLEGVLPLPPATAAGLIAEAQAGALLG